MRTAPGVPLEQATALPSSRLTRLPSNCRRSSSVLAGILAERPFDPIVALNITNLTFLPDSLKVKVLINMPEVFETLVYALNVLISKVDEFEGFDPRSEITNPIPSTSYFKNLSHPSATKWIVASIRNLTKFANIRTVTKAASSALCTIANETNICEVLTRLVYPFDNGDKNCGAHDNVIQFCVAHWKFSSISDFALDAIVNFLNFKTSRILMRKCNVHITFYRISESCISVFGTKNSDVMSASKPIATPFKPSILVMAMKAKTISCILSRTKYNVSGWRQRCLSFAQLFCTASDQ